VTREEYRARAGKHWAAWRDAGGIDAARWWALNTIAVAWEQVATLKAQSRTARSNLTRAKKAQRAK